MPKIIKATMEILVVNNGIIVKQGGVSWIYKNLEELFKHYQLEIGEHFNLIVEPIKKEKE